MAQLLWRGSSLLDGKPIFAALTGLDNPSRNRKTGPMLQTWVMRADLDPVTASQTNADVSVCGSCPLKGNANKGRSCYVTLFQAPLTIFKQLEKLKPLPKNAFRNHATRLGAYGDHAAIPTSITADIHKKSAITTGYSHQWRTCDQDLRHYLMASCETEEDRELAKQMGWSTFRVKKPEDPVLPMERPCPASKESGQRMVCYTCGRCTGGKKHDVVINIHGTHAAQRHFNLIGINQ
jgi:hypothetical protein